MGGVALGLAQVEEEGVEGVEGGGFVGEVGGGGGVGEEGLVAGDLGFVKGEVEVGDGDMGRVIGRRGRVANAIRAVNQHSKLGLREAPMLLMEFHGSEAGVKEQAEREHEAELHRGGCKLAARHSIDRIVNEENGNQLAARRGVQNFVAAN